MVGSRLQLFVTHLYRRQGVLIQIWSKNLHWSWNARTWKLKHPFFVILCSEILEKCRSVTLMVWHFEACEDFLTKFEWEPLDININEWQKVEVCCFLFSIISGHFKNGIYVLSLYWCVNTYAYHCMYQKAFDHQTDINLHE